MQTLFIVLMILFFLTSGLFFVLWLRAEGQKNDEGYAYVELALKYKRMKSEYNALLGLIKKKSRTTNTRK